MKLYTWERWTLGLILTSVGLLTGYASIFHVATWTMQNSPPGTSIVAGLTNAAISELIPVAALIVYRICRRHDRSTKLAVFLVVAAGSLSLSAQLAVAKASLSGWVVSAAPMAAFMLLTKLVVALLAPAHEPSPAPAVPRPVTKPAPKTKPVVKTKPAAKRSPARPSAGAASNTPPVPAAGPRSALPPSLTGRGKVAAAVATLGSDAPDRRHRLKGRRERKHGAAVPAEGATASLAAGVG
jgi:hypothetical protein